MAIIDHESWSLSEKGKKDAERHREKIDDVIRKGIKDVISEESIITKKRGRKVRIPVRGLKDYKFIYGQNGESGGIGQGEGKAGDVIGKKGKRNVGQNGKEGGSDNKGDDYMETEVDIDYLINILFEDLGLPWIEEKTNAKQLVPTGWKFETISKKGVISRLHKKRTMLESIKRTAMFVGEIIEETGCSYDDAYMALSQAKGEINDAIDIINNCTLNKDAPSSDTYIIDEDMRYKQIEHEYELHSNAVVIAMMDVSGSMTTDKKYLARSLLFWIVEFLKKVYDNVEIRFITHTTEAKIVDEDSFFYKGESGGTYCHTAIDKATYLIETEYPVNEWNVYCIYVSDGEDFDSAKTVQSMKLLLKKDINMLSYCEIDTEDNSGYYYGQSNVLIDNILKKWDFTEKSEKGTKFWKNEKEHFLLSVIKNKTHIWPCIKHILFAKR